MGVKSTVYLTRQEAVEKYVELYMKRKGERRARAKAAALSQTELENTLERWNDECSANGEEGFENYAIVQSHDDA